MKKTYGRAILTDETETIMKEDNISICVWPDDVWCFVEDVDEYLQSPAAKSDDYAIKEVHISLDEDDIDEYVYQYNRGNSPD